MSHVSVDVLTGFLGSGKTTLLSRVLEGCLADENVAVVMNELGDIGIDGRVVTGMDYVENVVELNSGCICCTIDEYRFDLAIQELVETVNPTLLVIESTGVADPDPLLYRIAQAGLLLDAVITVVDAANLGRAMKDSTATRAQIAAADFLVVNKVDLVTPAELGAVRKKLARLNKRALTMECERGRIDTDLLFGTSARRHRERARSAPSASTGPSHLESDHIGAFSHETPHPLDRARFERFLERLPSSVYRAKGFVRFADNAWSCLFNFTCGRYELNWVKLNEVGGVSQAVFIGREIDSVRERIVGDLTRCEVT